MNQIIKRIFLLTGQSKTTKKTFIIPTSSGFVGIGLTLYCLVAGMIYSNNLVLILGILLLLTTAFCSITTNFYLHNIHFENIRFLECHADEKITCELHCKDETQFENIRLSLAYIGGKIDFRFKEKRDEKLVYQATEKISRGKYDLLYLQYSTNYPFGLFYSWKSINFRNQKLYSYPVTKRIHNFHFAKPLIEDDRKIELGVDEYQRHQKGDERNLTGRVDWKRYFSKDEVWNKEYQKLQESKYLLKITEINPKNLENDLSTMAAEVIRLAQVGHDWELVGSNHTINSKTSGNHLKLSLRELAEYGS